MATVRIAHAEPRPGRLPNGEFHTRGYLVVLADDAGHRAVPIWLRAEPGEDDLSQLVELASRPAGEIVAVDVPEELTARLLLAGQSRQPPGAIPFPGSSYIQAVAWRTGDPCPQAATVLTYSESDNPRSPHYTDQTRLFSQRGWVVAYFCPTQVAAYASSTTVVETPYP
jgi:Penicillin amidase